MTELDEQLAAVPTADFDGSPIEDSLHMDMLVDGISAIHFVDGIGRRHYPINKTIATIILYITKTVKENLFIYFKKNLTVK